MVIDSELNSNQKIDYYDILGIEDKTMPSSEIKKRYNKLVAKYHPDKSKDADPQIFSLIQQAWNCLGNDEKRNIYDNKKNMEKNSKKNSHHSLKKKFENYQELKNTEKISDSDRKKNELAFNSFADEMNKKMSSGKIKYDDNAMTHDETNSRFNNLVLEREQQEIEFSQNRIFSEGSKFNDSTLQTFNKIFDEYKQKNDKNNIVQSKGGKPSAWNISAVGENSFTSLDTLNGDDNAEIYGSNYSSLDCFGCENRLDMNNIDVNTYGGASYVTGHNTRDENFHKTMETKLRERELETKDFEKNNATRNTRSSTGGTRSLSTLPTGSGNFLDDNIDRSYMFTHEVASDLWDDDDIDNDVGYACSKLIDLDDN